jgi:hypothetical protein
MSVDELRYCRVVIMLTIKRRVGNLRIEYGMQDSQPTVEVLVH